VHIGFAVVCISSPTLGAVLSGPLSKKFIGAQDRNVVPFLLVVTFLATASASPLPFVTGFWYIMASLWGYLFFGGILVPVMTTYMLNSIPDEAERAVGNSFANVLYFGLGYLPSPFMWGLVQ
jgi:MFS family permease